MASTTITVRFTTPGALGSGSATLSAEVDSREGGLNGGKSSFSPGEDVYILVFKSTNVSIVAIEASAGSITAAGSTIVNKTEDLTFAGQNTASLPTPTSSGLSSTKWLGKSGGAMTVGADQVTVTASSVTDKQVAVARVSYSSTADVYKLSSPATIDGEVEFTIAVLILGGVTA